MNEKYTLKKYSYDDEASIKVNAKSLKISELMSRILFNRNKIDDDKIYDFLKKEYILTDPTLISGMTDGIFLLVKKISENKKILLVGDYDADGILSTLMMSLFLKSLNVNFDYVINKRVNGHIISNDFLKKTMIETDSDFAIILDSSLEDSIDLDCDSFLIIDHHEISNKFKNLINPKNANENINGLKNLSTGGIVFYLIREFAKKSKKINLKNYLVLSALTTISDSMSLIGDNRIIVSYGLDLIFETDLVSFNVLLDNIDFKKYPDEKDVSFKIIPIINSFGRLDCAEDFISYIIDDSLESVCFVDNIVDVNKQRKKISDNLKKNIDKSTKELNNIVFGIVPYEYNGFLGLVSSYLSSRYNKASLVFSKNNEIVHCSCRGMNQDVLKIINFLKEKKIIIDGGGHKLAAGFHFKEEYFNNIVVAFDKLLKKELLEFEYNVKLDELDDQFLKFIYLIKPFGKSNPNPRLMISEFNQFKIVSISKEFCILVKNNVKIIFRECQDIENIINGLKVNNVSLVVDVDADTEYIQLSVISYIFH